MELHQVFLPLVLLCLFTTVCKALLVCSEYPRACDELQHQTCEDTDGDGQPDTCLCLPGFFLRIISCHTLPAGDVVSPCVDDDPCINGGQCVYNQTLRHMSCICLPGFTGQRCEINPSTCSPGQYLQETTNQCLPCPRGTFKYLEGNHSCTHCPLNAGGFRQVTPQEGSITSEQCTQGPNVESFNPLYGPMAGGTIISITVMEVPGYGITNISAIQVAGMPCGPLDSTSTLEPSAPSVTQCETSRVSHVRTGPLVITINGLDFTFNQTFAYKANPIISNISSSSTFTKGGKIITIYGEHFDSVFTPLITITAVFVTFSAKYVVTAKSRCTVDLPEKMRCKTPDLEPILREYYLPTTNRKAAEPAKPAEPAESAKPVETAKPAVSTSTTTIIITNTTATTTMSTNARSMATPSLEPQSQGLTPEGLSGRKKRAVAGGYAHISAFNTKHTTFWLGFELDGMDKYHNVSEVLPYGQIIVYPNPTLHSFKNNSQDVYYHDYDFYNGAITITGYYLDMGAGLEDYTVEIGREYCNVTYLALNSLHCLLPATLPLPRKDRIGGPTHIPRLRVKVGSLTFDIGLISYKVDMTPNIIIGVVVVVIIVIVVFVICACLLYSRRNRKDKTNNLQMGATPRPNFYSETNGHQHHQASNGRTNNGYLQPVHHVAGESDPGSPVASGDISHPALMPGIGAYILHEGVFSFTMDEGPGKLVLPNTENVAYQVPRHGSISFDIMDAISEDLKLIIEDCRLDSRRLQLEESIGKGFFGKVYRGLLADEHGKSATTVAIKTIQGKECTVKDVEAFLAEAIVMKDCHHDNVLSLLGVVVAGNRPFAVLPYMEHGDLKSYIAEPERGIKVRELLGFGVQVSAGMEYLACQKIVHRDLATRNCMVNEELTVCIADFGLSRDIYKSDYYRVEDKHRPLPVKWMAIESLTAGVFSASSDVWSFGVLMWELLTRGCPPYPDIGTFNLKNYLLSGRRLPQPEHAPDEVYAIMSSCWLERPEDRPTFTQLRDQLTNIVEEDEENMTPEYLKLI